MQDDFFEWDDDKAEKNLRKHGVSFKEASMAFEDAYGIELHDIDHSTPGEPRFLRIGMAGVKLLLVSYTMAGEKVRIIHARKAPGILEKKYEEERGEI